MSYYTLPKTNTTFLSPIETSTNSYNTCISHNYLNYYIKNTEAITNICKENGNYTLNSIFEKFQKTKIFKNNFSFYIFFEICTTFNIFDYYKYQPIKTLHIINENENENDIKDCINLFHKNELNQHICYNELNTDENNYDIMFFNLIINNDLNNLNDYFTYFIKILMTILKNQNTNGISIIKISHIFYKPIVDILFVLCSLYDKVYIIKSKISNKMTFEKYIICFNFTNTSNNITNYNILQEFLYKIQLNKSNILSILNYNISYYFNMKLNDINTIIGQKQIEILDNIINILKSKNVQDKLDLIQNSNIQKCISWCDKHKLPYNKTNIFLKKCISDDNETISNLQNHL